MFKNIKATLTQTIASLKSLSKLEVVHIEGITTYERNENKSWDISESCRWTGEDTCTDRNIEDHVLASLILRGELNKALKTVHQANTYSI